MTIIRDPIPDLQNAITALGWRSPYRVGVGMMAFSPIIVVGPRELPRRYRLGFFIDIPVYETGPVIVKIAACDEFGEMIFDYKEAKHRVGFSETAPALAKLISNMGEQILPAFGDQMISRICQADTIKASLEECLSVNTCTDNRYYKDLRIDDALTAHKLVSPADKWTMYRRQANTPKTKLNLVDILASYSTAMTQDLTKRVELSTRAGDELIDRGDLEARPAWHHWEQ